MLKGEYEALRMQNRMEAFKTTIIAHATSGRPYSANLREQIDIVMHKFDEHFPKEQGK